ncbi:ATP-dependent helicase [Peptostreptococcus canis]|uniref:DNA 3'-5' helicase n=1 Tax=Peptostreptococcus canis TaxID=1159213 RepID=A0ABR6TLA8_9FIRM|nr:ATP-dependent helicase [Peptostreptococcus canis]MBC2576115.1 ATP-dependent helicase [Peptostreptococcus canis]MBP1997759.1 DNA helicase-2/ATP-dependent DNA helicase PcrA [Peptostreptococcus canis]
MSVVYRKDQKKIMEYKSGTMGIQAVPGAGKTFIITNLVAKLLKYMQEEELEGKILILTYMNSAANNFKSRIGSLVDENGISRSKFEVMTIHSLAMKIIKENSSLIFMSEDSDIIDDYKKAIFINEAIEEYKGIDNNETKISSFIDKKERMNENTIEKWNGEFTSVVSNTIKLLKYASIDDDYLKGIVEDDYRGIMKIMSPIYSIYQTKLRYSGFMDYDDILIMAYKILSENKSVAQHYQEKYRYVFEDECQDSNSIQGKIIDIISANKNIRKKSKKNLVRVGDVNQSITGTFTGSNPKFFVDFCKNADYSYEMNMAGRSSKNVIDLANKLVEYVNLDEEKPYYNSLEPLYIHEVEKGKGYRENPITDKYLINTKSLNDTFEEFDMIVKTVKYYNEKYPSYSVGVLCFSNFDVENICERFDDQNIIYDKLGADSKERKKLIEDIKYIIDFILDSDIDRFIDMFLNSFVYRFNEFDISHDEELKLRERMADVDVDRLIYEENYLLDIISKAKVCMLDENRKSFYDNSIKGLKALKRILEKSPLNICEFIGNICSELNLNIFEQQLGHSIVFYFEMLSRFEKIDFSRVSTALDKKNSRVFEPAIDSIYNIGEKEPEAGSVTVSTLHKSKGMEWDAVVIFGINNSEFPSKLSDYFRIDRRYLREGYKYPEAFINREIDIISGNKVKNMVDYEVDLKKELIEERIRLLYVGITRAKRSLLLLNSKQKFIESIGKNIFRKDSEFFSMLSSFVKLEKDSKK